MGASARLIAITMVRDEADVIGTSIRWMLTRGVDEVLVVDNGSTDATPRILRRLSRRFPVQVIREDGDYDQAATMTALAAEAHRRGAAWVVPFDADEFLFSALDLRDVLTRTAVHALRLPVVQLVQRRRSVRRRDPLASMDHIARPWARHTDVMAGRASFVELAYPPKVLFRAAPNVTVKRGQHRIDHPDGPARRFSGAVSILHAPLRDLACLRRKVDRAARHLGATGDPDAGWQYRMWADKADSGDLEAEWRANSHANGILTRQDGSHEVLARVPRRLLRVR